jgi:hypothetical protein
MTMTMLAQTPNEIQKIIVSFFASTICRSYQIIWDPPEPDPPKPNLAEDARKMIRRKMQESHVTAADLKAFLEAQMAKGGLSERDSVIREARDKVSKLQNAEEDARKTIRRKMKEADVTAADLKAFLEAQMAIGRLSERESVIRDARDKVSKLQKAEDAREKILEKMQEDGITAAGLKAFLEAQMAIGGLSERDSVIREARDKVSKLQEASVKPYLIWLSFCIFISLLITCACLGMLLLVSWPSQSAQLGAVVVELPSLIDIAKQRRIRINEGGPFQIDKAQDVSIVGLLGSDTQGKDWFIKRIFGGTSTPRNSTRPALNMVYHSTSKRLLIDTISPARVSVDDITKTCLSELVLGMSHVVLYFTADYSWVDQAVLLQYRQRHARSGQAIAVLTESATHSEKPEAEKTPLVIHHYRFSFSDSSPKLNERSMDEVTKLTSPTRLVNVAELLANTTKSLLSPLLRIEDGSGKLSSSSFDVTFDRDQQECSLSISSGENIIKPVHDGVAAAIPSVYETDNGEVVRERIFELEVPGVVKEEISIIDTEEGYLLKIHRRTGRDRARESTNTIRIPVDRSWNFRMQDDNLPFKIEDGIFSLIAWKEYPS